MQQKLSNKDKKSILNTVQRRLSWEYIKDQHRLIKHMSPNLSVCLHDLQADPHWHAVPSDKMKRVLLEIPFVKLMPGETSASPIVKLEYENADRIVIVTGIKTEVVEEIMNNFIGPLGFNKRFQVLNCKDMKYWYSIEMNTFEAAISCKKFIRGMKTQFDSEANSSYKIARRRVRIVLLNEDFYTILVDAMMENKAQKFAESFSSKPFEGLTYYPLSLSTEERTQGKGQEEIDDANSWEIQSKSSEFYYEDKINDIDIEKVNQGIQYEKIEAAMTEEQEAVGEQQEGIWTQTEEENVVFEQQTKLQINVTLVDVEEKEEEQKPEEIPKWQQHEQKALLKSSESEESDSDLKANSKDQNNVQQNAEAEKQQKDKQSIKEKSSDKQGNKQKDSEPKQNTLRSKLRSLSAGITQQTPNTSQHPTQTSRVIIQGKSIERPKYVYPSATTPTLKTIGSHNFQIERIQEQGLQKIGGEKPEPVQQQILQISCAGMRKKFQEYLKKVGRKQIDIPIYIKRETDRVIFKNKFLDQVIRQANQTRLTKY